VDENLLDHHCAEYFESRMGKYIACDSCSIDSKP
jgi:hypothetical protein